LGLAFGTLAYEAGKRRVSVGRDCRLTSDRYAAALTEGLVATGLTVVDLGICPTPLMYFSLFHSPTLCNLSESKLISKTRMGTY